ncbi:MAG: divalent metal cation transporter [Cryomorphaceae bacterium]|nr:divalent metal cation transporter [Cryomorphaceae bacterium]
MIKTQTLQRFFKSIGPGLLFAAAAIGVSHLVQSTRAGALYGLFFIPIILLTNFLKWPFFEAGPRYAQSTGKSLIHAYRIRYPWALGVVSFITVGSMFIVQATVTMVTAGLLQFLLPSSFHESLVIAVLLLVSVGILWWGKYSVLDKIIRYIVVILALATLIAVLIGLRLPMPVYDWTAFDWVKTEDIAFLVALLGWMPAPLDISIWHSTWTVAGKDVGKKPYQPWDFRVGYWGTTIMAVLFLLLGAIFLFSGKQSIPTSAVDFAGHLMDVYAQTLGKAYWLVLMAAVACMFSTTLAVLDAYPRVCTFLMANAQKDNEDESASSKWYRPLVVLVAVGAWLITSVFSGQMISLVQLATTIAFVSAPVIAFLNIKSMELLEKSQQPVKLNTFTAYFGLAALTVFSVYYLFIF